MRDMRDIKKTTVLAFFLVLSVLAAKSVFCFAADTDIDKIFNFARELFAEGEYYRAITEFRRYIYLRPNTTQTDESHVYVAKSYFLSKDFENCVGYIEANRRKISDRERLKEIRLIQGDCYTKMENYSMALDVYEELRTDYPDISDTISFKVAHVYILEGEWKKASHAYGGVRRESKLGAAAAEAAELVLEGEDIVKKSPVTGGVLAAIMPGAGHLYTGRRQDAIVSFGLNGLFIWGIVEAFRSDNPVLGGILSFFELGWYGGNIQGAINGVYKYNAVREEEFRQKVNKTVDFSIKNLEDGGREGFIYWNMKF